MTAEKMQLIILQSRISIVCKRILVFEIKLDKVWHALIEIGFQVLHTHSPGVQKKLLLINYFYYKFNVEDHIELALYLE